MRAGAIELNDTNEDVWRSTNGAIFLAKFDDDSTRCRSSAASDATSNHASHTIINDVDERFDLAPLQVRAWASAIAGPASVSLTFLRAGVTYLLEGLIC